MCSPVSTKEAPFGRPTAAMLLRIYEPKQYYDR